MRIGCVYAARPKRWPKFRWVQDALESLGHETQHILTPDDLKAAQCDWILFEHKSAGIGPNHIRDIHPHRTCPWSQWWFDAIFTHPGTLADQPVWQVFGDNLKCFDSVYVKERGRIEELRTNGVNAAYMDQGCPSWLGCCEYRDEPEFDVVLFGNRQPKYGHRRNDVQTLVKSGFKVGWAGDGGSVPEGVIELPWTPAERLPELASRARCVLSVNLFEMDGYWSDRLWLALGAGAIVVAREMNGGPTLPYLEYDSGESLIQAMNSIREMETETRRSIGTRCRQIVMANHTYERRLEAIVGQERSMHVLPG